MACEVIDIKDDKLKELIDKYGQKEGMTKYLRGEFDNKEDQRYANEILPKVDPLYKEHLLLNEDGERKRWLLDQKGYNTAFKRAQDINKSSDTILANVIKVSGEKGDNKQYNSVGLQYRSVDNILDRIKTKGSFEGTPIEYTNIGTSTSGTPIGMRNINKGEKILIDENVMKQKFNELAWTKPYTQRDGSKAKALPFDTFQSPKELTLFSLLHEKAHEYLLKKDSENIGDYETRINNEALRKLSPIVGRDLLHINNQYFNKVLPQSNELYKGESKTQSKKYLDDLQSNLYKQLQILKRNSKGDEWDETSLDRLQRITQSLQDNKHAVAIRQYHEYVKEMIGSDGKKGQIQSKLEELRTQFNDPTLTDDQRVPLEMKYANHLLEARVMLNQFTDSNNYYAEGFTDINQNLRDELGKIRGTLANVPNLSFSVDIDTREFYRGMLTKLSTDPKVIKGLMDIFDAQSDENWAQAYLNSTADTHFKYLALVRKNYDLHMGEAESKIREKNKWWRDHYIKLNGNFDQYLIHENGKRTDRLITEYDPKHGEEARRLYQEQQLIEARFGKDSDEALRGVYKQRMWNKENYQSPNSKEYDELFSNSDPKPNDSDQLKEQKYQDWKTTYKLNKEAYDILYKNTDYINEGDGKIDKGLISDEDWDRLSQIDKEKEVIRNKYSTLSPKEFSEKRSSMADFSMDREAFDKANENSKRKAEEIAMTDPVSAKEYRDKWLTRNTRTEFHKDFWNEYTKLAKDWDNVCEAHNWDNKYEKDYERINEIKSQYKKSADGNIDPKDMSAKDKEEIATIERGIASGRMRSSMESMRYWLENTKGAPKEILDKWDNHIKSTKGVSDSELYDKYKTMQSEVEKLGYTKQDMPPDAKRVIEEQAKLYSYVPTQHYEEAYHEAQLKGDTEFKKWYNDNHVYNVFDDKYNPTGIWTTLHPNHENHILTEQPTSKWGEWVVKGAKDRNGNVLDDKVNYTNPNYREDSNGKSVPSDKWKNQEYIRKGLANDKWYQEFTKELGSLSELSKSSIIKHSRIPAVELKEHQSPLKKLGITWDKFNTLRKEAANKLFTPEAQQELRKIGVDANGQLLQSIPFRHISNLNAEEYEQPTGKETYEELQEFFKRQNEIYERNKEAHINSMDFDIKNVMNEFIKTAMNFNAKKEIESTMLLAREVMKDMDVTRKFGKSGIQYIDKSWADLGLDEKKPITMKGLESKVFQHYNSWLTRVFYEQHANDEGMLKDAISQIMNFTSLKNIGFNPFTGINRMLLGNINMMMETKAGIYWNTEDSRLGDRYYRKQMLSYLTDRNNVKANSIQDGLIKYFDIVKSHNELNHEAGGDLMTKIWKAKWFKDSAFAIMQMDEHYIQNSVLFRMMHANKLIDGKLYSWYDYKNQVGAAHPELSEAQLKDNFKNAIRMVDMYELKDGYTSLKKGVQLDKYAEEEFKRKVLAVNQYMHGIYNVEDKGEVNKYALARMAMQFKNHWKTGWDKHWGSRFGEGFYNEHRNAYEEGLYITTGKFVLGLLSDSKHMLNKAKEQWASMDDVQRANIKRFGVEMGFFISCLGLGLVTHAIRKNLKDDDKWKKRFLGLILVQTDRLRQETSMYTPTGLHEELKGIQKSPGASVQSISNMMDLLYELPMTFFRDENKTKKTVFGNIAPRVHHGGVYDGEGRLTVKALQNFTLLRQLQAMKNLGSEVTYEGGK